LDPRDIVLGELNEGTNELLLFAVLNPNMRLEEADHLKPLLHLLRSELLQLALPALRRTIFEGVVVIFDSFSQLSGRHMTGEGLLEVLHRALVDLQSRFLLHLLIEVQLYFLRK
jgi:hypothetical protein